MGLFPDRTTPRTPAADGSESQGSAEAAPESPPPKIPTFSPILWFKPPSTAGGCPRSADAKRPPPGSGASRRAPGAAALRHSSPAPRCRGWVFSERKESRGSASWITPAHRGNSGLAAPGPFPGHRSPRLRTRPGSRNSRGLAAQIGIFLGCLVVLSKRNAFAIPALALPSVLLALSLQPVPAAPGPGCGRSGVATTSRPPTPRVSPPLGPQQSHFSENSPFSQD